MEQSITELRKAEITKPSNNCKDEEVKNENKRLFVALNRIVDTCHPTCNDSRNALNQAYKLLNELDPMRMKYQPKRINNEEGA